ncbi:hypothetical protein MYP_3257 [Sporocytophaga myxococcoides]|uniref:Uncharacterized protein n=1 Tax=Sporocytophaga myxococcoides TaxID=153721 RepID=A0A098LIM3_9BACT|nr:hypothetical protein [Sporocytophaga myxococcoides]GAL86028.1 hypothetical protein MYP_3257 [Sporocytophaga myxococcoides]
MISHKEFSSIRLKDYISEEEIELTSGYEYLDQQWTGEIYGFSSFLRPYDLPESLECISLYLSEFEKPILDKIFRKIGLDIKSGESETELTRKLGKPVNKLSFVEDRNTFQYLVKKPEEYLLNLTIHNEDGLFFIDVICNKKVIEEIDFLKKSKDF